MKPTVFESEIGFRLGSAIYQSQYYSKFPLFVQPATLIRFLR